MKYHLSLFIAVLLAISCKPEKTTSTTDYYPIADNNEWRYTAPDGWKDGDYISRIEEDSQLVRSMFDRAKKQNNWTPQVDPRNTFFRHYDATKASKIITEDESGIWYLGETFASDSSFVLFDEAILWFEKDWKVGHKLKEKREFTRYFSNDSIAQGTFQIRQELINLENVLTPLKIFEQAMCVGFDTHWDFLDGNEAKSENVYHYAPEVGVVMAYARFILLKNGKEYLNRLVTPKLKNYTLPNKEH